MLTNILSLGTSSCIFLLIAIGYTIQVPNFCFCFVIVNHNNRQHHHKHHHHKHHHNKHQHHKHQLSLLSLSAIKTTGSESESTTTTIGTTIIDDDDEQSKKIPIHLLAGFLGSGKTTTLKHILENNDHGLKIGIIVNDIASVNIDAKFILSSSSSSTSSSSSSSSKSNDRDDGATATTTTTTASNDGIINDDIVELQNGCACCSLAGELFDSIESLLLRTTSSTTGMYDAIIVELSGVADPIAIQNNWRDRVINNDNKESYGTSLLVTNRTEIGNIITVVDATTFSSDYMTFDVLKDRQEWYATPTTTATTADEQPKQKLPHSVNRQVVELLAEQIEAASIVIVNKQDIASTNEVVIAMELIKSLNVDASIIATSNGQIDIQNVLGVQVLPDETTSLDNDDDDDDNDDDNNDEHSHSHHDHDATTTCDNDDNDDDDDDDDDRDPSHSHSHDDHVTAATPTPTCEDTACTDPSHTHSHEHDHSSSSTTCDDTDCTDPSHSHDHSSGTTCEDTACTDPTHSHSHEHDHSSSSGSTSMTSTTNLGISNFVYRASKPFNANRLMKLIWSWPIPIKDELAFITFDFNNNEEEDAEKDEDKSLAKIGYGVDNNDDDSDDDSTTTTTTNVSPFIGVLRSKGFCWIAPTAWDGLLDDSWRHDKAMYWSHAGKHMGIQMGK